MYGNDGTPDCRSLRQKWIVFYYFVDANSQINWSSVYYEVVQNYNHIYLASYYLDLSIQWQNIFFLRFLRDNAYEDIFHPLIITEFELHRVCKWNYAMCCRLIIHVASMIIILTFLFLPKSVYFWVILWII